MPEHHTPEAVTIGELHRAVLDLRSTISQLHVQQVTQKVFDVEKELTNTRINLLVEAAKDAEKERRADRRVIYSSLAAGVVAILLNIYSRAQGAS